MNYFGIVVFVSCICVGVHSLPMEEIRKEDQSIKSNSTITISFYATDLSGCSRNSTCDTSVTVICASYYSDWKVCGQTNRIRNDNNPVWPEVFTFNHVPGSSQRWRFDLKDHNLLVPKLMGSFYYIVDEFAGMKDSLIQNEVPGNRGVLWIQRLEEDEGPLP